MCAAGVFCFTDRQKLCNMVDSMCLRGNGLYHAVSELSGAASLLYGLYGCKQKRPAFCTAFFMLKLKGGGIWFFQAFCFCFYTCRLLY